MKTNNNITSFKQLLLTVVALLVMAGCSSDSWEGTPDALTNEVEPVPIRLSVKGNVVITSDVAMTNIKPHVLGDVQNSVLDAQEVGIFVIDATTLADMQTGTNFSSKYSEEYANFKGSIGEDGEITPLDESGQPAKLYYPKVKETTVYVLVYAPYKADITLKKFRNGFPFTVQNEQSTQTNYIASDLLVGWTKVTTTNFFKNVSASQAISLRHAMSRVALNLNHTDYAGIESALKNASVTAKLSNVKTTATVNLYSTMLTADNSENTSNSPAEVVIDEVKRNAETGTLEDVTMATKVAFSSSTEKVYCLVPPQTVNDEDTKETDEVRFAVKVYDTEDEANVSEESRKLAKYTFKGGKSYLFTFPWTTP